MRSTIAMSLKPVTEMIARALQAAAAQRHDRADGEPVVGAQYRGEASARAPINSSMQRLAIRLVECRARNATATGDRSPCAWHGAKERLVTRRLPVESFWLPRDFARCLRWPSATRCSSIWRTPSRSSLTTEAMAGSSVRRLTVDDRRAAAAVREIASSCRAHARDHEAVDAAREQCVEDAGFALRPAVGVDDERRIARGASASSTPRMIGGKIELVMSGTTTPTILVRLVRRL